MARIRTMKPSFWGDERVAKLTRDARLLLAGLISMADDDGRFLASPNAVNGYVFPNDDLPPAKVAKWLDEIARVGIIHTYRPDAVTYGCLPNWHKHQKINRYTPSQLPEPDVECYPRKTGGSGDDE